MKRITLMALMTVLSSGFLSAQTSCVDWNGYVNSKNSGGTGYYTLLNGFEEHAAQTYNYSGPGKVSQVRVYGNYPYPGGVPLRISIYHVDANGRPTSLISSADDIFWSVDNAAGYINVSMPAGGTSVDGPFAIGVGIRNAWPFGNTFQLRYTGEGEGQGADLTSLSGTSTGGNWASALTTFNRDGDFYLVPQMTHFITADFDVFSQCVATNSMIPFDNNSSLSKDSMFNRIGLAAYTGTQEYYSWNFGDGSAVSNAVNPTHSFVTAGSYTVSLTTTIVGWNTTCTNTKTKAISVGLAAQPPMATAVSCNGGSNGTVTGSATGGAAPYAYSLNGDVFQPSALFTSLAAGNHQLYVKDQLGCVVTVPFNITQPNPLVVAQASSTSAACGASDGAILVNMTGGVGTITYQLNTGAFQSSGSFVGLSAGTYSVTAKDGNNCTKTISINVNNLGSPILSVLSTTNNSCFGLADGTITLSATGGVGNLAYSINGGSTFQASGTFAGLAAGIYQAVVKDASNCRSATTITIAQPNPILFQLSSEPASCFGTQDGAIAVTGQVGGIGNYTYSLTNIVYQSSPNFANLAAGTYTIYVRDAASCTVQHPITIAQPQLLAATTTIDHVDCNGENQGTITINATGGTSPYVFTINDEGVQPFNQFNNLSAGNYTMEVMDDHGCSAIVNAIVNQPTVITATPTATNATCGNNNGAILVVATGGSGSGYQFSLDGVNFNTTGSFTSLMAGNYYITVKDGLGCSIVVYKAVQDANGPSIGSVSTTNVACYGGHDGTLHINGVTGGTGTLLYSTNGVVWSVNPNFSNLSAGSYTVYVKDANGCIGTSTVQIIQPSAFVMSTALDQVDCYYGNSGSATVFAAGGAGTLAYSINNGASFQSSNTFNALTAGNYTIIVRDAASCTGEISFTITQPQPINFAVGILNLACHNDGDGAIVVYANGGTGALTYSINGTTYQTSNVFSNLDGGLYNVYVKDANGCTSSHGVSVEEPAQLLINAAVSNVSCAGGNNGVINLSVSGGNGIHSIVWSNGALSEDIFGLSAGAYSVVVEDNNGCTTSGAFVLTEPLQPIVINAVITHTTSSTGEIDVTVTGGTSPYTYLWSDGAQTADLGDLQPGDYLLTVTDANGCVASDAFTVEDVTGISALSIDFGLQVYPNPTRGILNISAKEMIDELVMYDFTGRQVLSSQPRATVVSEQLENVDAGVYNVRVKINEQWITKRIEVIK
jgi:hypothetical protein